MQSVEVKWIVSFRRQMQVRARRRVRGSGHEHEAATPEEEIVEQNKERNYHKCCSSRSGYARTVPWTRGFTSPILTCRARRREA